MTTTREYLLDSLAESKDASTRAYAAYRGRELDKLVNDPAAEFLKRQGMIKCANCLQYTSKGNYCEQCGCKQINRHKGEA